MYPIHSEVSRRKKGASLSLGLYEHSRIKLASSSSSSAHLIERIQGEGDGIYFQSRSREARALLALAKQRARERLVLPSSEPRLVESGWPPNETLAVCDTRRRTEQEPRVEVLDAPRDLTAAQRSFEARRRRTRRAASSSEARVLRRKARRSKLFAGARRD